MKARADFSGGWLRRAGLLAAWMLAGAAGRAAEPSGLDRDIPEEAGGKIVTMSRFEVIGSVLGSIEVNFTLNKTDVRDPTAAIYWATVTGVIPGSTAQKAGFRPGEELIRLNDHLIRGLTLGDFFTLIAHERRQGDLIWKVRRGMLGLDSTIVFNGKLGPPKAPK